MSEELIKIRDVGRSAALMLLYLFMPFDMIDHALLMKRLRDVAVLGKGALLLEDRWQEVKLGP